MAYNLYIIMRTDMDSMNPGKGMAQAAHAANEAVASMQKHYGDNVSPLTEWKQNREFGTTIVLGTDNFEQLKEVVYQFSDLQQNDIFSGLVFDPTYPLKDGKVTHLISLITCGWVFAEESEWRKNRHALELKLHP